MTRAEKTKWGAAGLLLLALGIIGAVAEENWETTEGVGTDLAVEQQCLDCHGALQEKWNSLSSHKLLFDCGMCHLLNAPSGAGHAAKQRCGECHSTVSHPPDAACNACHDVHGSANAFLLRDSLNAPDGLAFAIHVTKPEGASADGLARAGVPDATPGTGICEVCHLSTSVYNRAGTGAPHNAEWCGECHDHQQGFATGGQ